MAIFAVVNTKVNKNQHIFMKKIALKAGVVIALTAAFGFNSCIGSFALTNRLLSWNRSIDNKIVNELVFFAFWVLPVYEVAAVADALVINSIEFWSGENPMAMGTSKIQGSDGQIYLVKCDGKGYDIISKTDGSKVRLDFDSTERRWDVITPAGDTFELMTFIDDTHVSLPTADGERATVELTDRGLYAYRNSTGAFFAAR